MCIICNMPPDAEDKADAFLVAYAAAQFEIRRATDAMLACAKVDHRYDRVHKRMVKLLREWNELEHQREVDHDAERQAKPR